MFFHFISNNNNGIHFSLFFKVEKKRETVEKEEEESNENEKVEPQQQPLQSGSGRRYLPFFAHLQKEQQQPEVSVSEDEPTTPGPLRYVSVIQRTPLFRPREPEAEKKRELIQPSPKPKKEPQASGRRKAWNSTQDEGRPGTNLRMKEGLELTSGWRKVWN